jgi:hypothetical protein
MATPPQSSVTILPGKYGGRELERGGETHPHPSTSSGQALTSPFKGEEFYRIKVLDLDIWICSGF